RARRPWSRPFLLGLTLLSRRSGPAASPGILKGRSERKRGESMTEEELSPLSGLWDAPLRRDVRIPAQPLPSAAPVVHAAARPPAVHRGRLSGGFAAVPAIGLGATTASVLTSGAGIAGPALTAEADVLGHGAAALSGGGAGPHDVGRAG